MTNTFEIRSVVTAIHIRYKNLTLECLIDTADLPAAHAIPGQWHAMWSADSATYYVIGKVDGRPTLLHRHLTAASPENEVDHLHHYGLDNRRAQLRVCSRAVNAANRRGANVNNVAGIPGVYWHKKTGKWRAQTRIDGKRRDVPGGFDTPEAAMYAKKAIEQAVPAEGLSQCDSM